MACERWGASRFTFPGPFRRRRPLCGANSLCEALPFLWCAHRARTAKLLARGPRTWPVAIQWRGAFGGRSSGLEGRWACQMACNRSARKLRAPRQRQRPCLANGPCANRFAVRALCAHPRNTFGVSLAGCCARAGGTAIGVPSAERCAQVARRENFFFCPLKNLATGEEKYVTILATERRTMPSNGEGMLCHGC
jgi:hypothetical protein